jgi:hypothetical protein
LNKTQKHNTRQKSKTIGRIFYLNFDKLSDKQKKMLQEIFKEKRNDGIKPKQALEEAYQIVTCFKM